VTRNSKEKKENVNRNAWRHKASARRKRPPAKRQPSTTVSHRLAGPGHCQGVHANFHHYLAASAWRWEASARRQSRWCGKLALFLLFSRGKNDLWHFGGTKNTFGELGGVLGLVGTAPSSSLYLFLFHFFHLQVWALHDNGELNPFLLGLDVATKLLCKCKCFDYIYDSFINC